MWKDLNLEELAEAEHAQSPPRTPDDVEALVVLVRLERYNRGQPCGAHALCDRLRAFYHLTPLPSARTIGRTLARHSLTHGRTGRYAGER